jgi:long-chain acyl-CoA synthetase
MLTMTSALVRASKHYAARPAMIDSDGRETSWAEHCDEVARLAGALSSAGIKPGSHYAILARNSARQATLIHAGYWLGAIPIPINTRLAPAEIAQILEECEPDAVWVSDATVAALESPELANWRSRTILLDPVNLSSQYPCYDEMLAAAIPLDPGEPADEDIAILLYTGGTTGRGKGVPLSHRNIISNGLQVGLALSAQTTDRMLHVAPMFHSADLLGTAITLCGGAHCYLGTPDPQAIVDRIESLGITYTMVPPAVLHGILTQDLLRGRTLDALRVFIVGGAPVPFELLSAAQEFLGRGSMVQGYGLTETSPIIAMMHYRQVEALHGSNAEALGSVGLPLAGLDLRLVDESGSVAAAGEAGEIVVRGPNVAAAYLYRPEATREAFRRGWYHTGDLGKTDGDGFLTIVDRKKDMIITGGENVYSAEVEGVLLRHPDISEAAVIGIPDDRYGEAVFAVLVAREGSAPKTAEIIHFARRHIGGYKIPRQMVFAKQLPKSALGKTLKAELRARYS